MKNPEIKKKVLSILTKNGKKSLSEKILLQSLKVINKTSKKQSIDIFKVALVLVSPTFKLYKLKGKKKKKKKKNIKIKEVPSFLKTSMKRNSAAIKLMIKNSTSSKIFFKSFSQEIMLSAQKKSV